MHTIIIYDQFGEDDIQFNVLEGDYSHLDRVFVNSTHEKADELYELIFDFDGNYKVEKLPKFPLELVTPDTKVIVAGFIP